MSYQQQTPAAHESNGSQYPPHGERVKHPRHGDGANCTKKHSSPANPILDDPNGPPHSRNANSLRSSLTVAEVEAIRSGAQDLGRWQGYLIGVRETRRELAPLREAEKKELYLGAWWDAMHVRISTQHKETVERALTAAFSPRCFNCGVGRGEAFEGVDA